MMRFLWLAMAAAFAGLSLLTLVEAPGVTGWKLAILATQFGHWLSLLALVCAAGAWLAGRVRRGNGRSVVRLVSIATFVVAAVLLMVPTFRCWPIGRGAPVEMATAFGDSKPQSDASFFSLGELYSLSSRKPVTTEVATYSRGDGHELALEFFRPERSGRVGLAPCVMLVHGGGWDSGTRNELSGFSHWLARSGYAIIAIDYRLAPKWTWPAPREDVLAAFAWLRENASRLGVDLERVVLFGRSAGAQIAMTTAYGEARAAVRGVIGFYGPADMNFAYEHGTEDDVLRSPSLLRAYFDGPPSERGAAYSDASAILRVSRDVPPTLLVHGRLDTLVWRRQSERLDAKLRAVQARAYFLAIPAATHALEYNLNSPGGQLARGAVLRFLAATIGE